MNKWTVLDLRAGRCYRDRNTQESLRWVFAGRNGWWGVVSVGREWEGLLGWCWCLVFLWINFFFFFFSSFFFFTPLIWVLGGVFFSFFFWFPNFFLAFDFRVTFDCWFGFWVAFFLSWCVFEVAAFFFFFLIWSLQAFGFWFDFDFWLLVFGFWLLIFGFWFSVFSFGFWFLVFGDVVSAMRFFLWRILVLGSLVVFNPEFSTPVPVDVLISFPHAPRSKQCAVRCGGPSGGTAELLFLIHLWGLWGLWGWEGPRGRGGVLV